MAHTSIAIALHQGVQALDVAGPIDVFAEANSHVGPDEGYRTVLMAEGRGPQLTSSGIRLLPDLAFDESDGRFDIILVAGGPGLPAEQGTTRLVDWMKSAPQRATTWGSICTGAFVLGHAGLLDDRCVTTHWQNAHQLAAMFPSAKVEQDAIYVRDGGLITSAGVTAGIDLALALVREHHGTEVALAVAKRLVVVAQRQGGQSQFSPYLDVAVDPASPLAVIQEHVMARLNERHTLASLAAAAEMGTRSLARHFMQQTGITPHEFVLRARIDAARMLLESSRRPLKTVAYDCGFGTADRMRAVFTQRLGITPAQYRGKFRSPDTDRPE